MPRTEAQKKARREYEKRQREKGAENAMLAVTGTYKKPEADEIKRIFAAAGYASPAQAIRATALYLRNGGTLPTPEPVRPLTEAKPTTTTPSLQSKP